MSSCAGCEGQGHNKTLGINPSSKFTTTSLHVSSTLFTEHHASLFSCRKSAFSHVQWSRPRYQGSSGNMCIANAGPRPSSAQGSEQRPSQDHPSAFADRLHTRMAVSERIDPLHYLPRSNRTAASSRPANSETPLPFERLPFLRNVCHTMQNVYHNLLAI